MYIGNITACHKDTALLMLESGKPVLCEKSLTASPQDTATLIKTAKEKNLFLMEVSFKYTKFCLVTTVCIMLP